MNEFEKKQGFTIAGIINRLVDLLSSKPPLAGLYITQTSVQYLMYSGGKTDFLVRPLLPGVVVNGKLQEPDKLLQALNSIRSELGNRIPKRMVPAVLVLPPGIIFVQSFRVPKIGSAAGGESPFLNLQMSSPFEPGHAYMSYECISRQNEFDEFIGAAGEREVINKYTQVLEGAGFYAVAVESAPFALSRIVRNSKAEYPKAFLFLFITSEGAEFVVMRNLRVAFVYFYPWSMVLGENGELLKQDFLAALEIQVKKIAHFSISRYGEILEHAYFAAPGLESEVQPLLAERCRMTPHQFMIQSSVSPVSYPVLGAALRGMTSRRDDEEVSVAPSSSINVYYAEQLVLFLRYWRNLFVGTGFVFLLVYLGVNTLLTSTQKLLQARLDNFQGSYSDSLNELHGRVNEFNTKTRKVVAARAAAETGAFDVYRMVSRYAALAGVTFDNFSFQGYDRKTSITMNAPQASAALKLREMLLKETSLYEVEVPLVSLFGREDTSLTFTLSFKAKRPDL